jgi:hypothetical protein
MYLRLPIKTRVVTAVGTKDSIRTGGDRSLRNHLHHPKGGERFFCWLHGVNTSLPFGDQEENRVGSGGEGDDSGLRCEPRHEVPEPRTVQGSTATVSPPVFPACGAHASVPANASIHSFDATAATTPPMHTQQPSIFVPSWPNPPIHHQTPYNQ